MPPELVILCGLQASGKSTFRREHFGATHAVVSKDHFRNNRRPGRRQRVLIEEALRAGRPVVVDNTNPTAEERAEIIALARSHGASVACYYFDAGLEGCLERNRLREGEARVPDVGLYATARRLRPPTPAEGFDAVFVVRLLPGGGFEVSRLEEACGEGR